MTARLVHIYRYPVKGLSGELLAHAELRPGETVGGDRRFAFARPGTAFDAAAPAWQPKTNFLALMRDERLAELRAHFDDGAEALSVWRGREPVLQVTLTTPEGRAAAEDFFEAFMAEEIGGRPTLCEAPGHSFSDVDAKVVSIINLTSVLDLADAIGAPIDHRRFRANLYIDGLDAWQEFDWVDRRIRIGDVEADVIKRIRRCAATNVDPATGRRDLNIPAALVREEGHADLGIYARVVQGGSIAPGATVAPVG